MNDIVYVTNVEPDINIGRGRAATIGHDGSGELLVNDFHTYSVRWSPQGDKLALTTEFAPAIPVNEGIVYVTALDGSSPLALNPGSSVSGPGGDFTPDGLKFAIPATDIPGFYLIPTAGGSPVPVTLSDGQYMNTGLGTCQSIIWFPDDTGLAYTGQNPVSGYQEIRTCNPDGSGVATILGGGIPNWWGLCDAYDNGDLLVILVPQLSPPAPGQLIRCHRDGTGQTVLYDDPAGMLIGGGTETGAALSPDETQIVIACNDGTLRTMPAAGGALTTIATDAYPAHGAFGSVDWADDGTPPPMLFSTIAAGAQRTGIIRS